MVFNSTVFFFFNFMAMTGNFKEMAIFLRYYVNFAWRK